MTPSQGKRAPLARLQTAVVITAAIAAIAATVLVWYGLAERSEGEQPSPRASADTAAAEPRSRPDLDPPLITVDEASAAPDAHALIFLSPRMENPRRDSARQQQGALALDGEGRTVWFRPAKDGEPVTDLRVQTYRGEPVLTWWHGAASKMGVGRGEGVIVDDRYRTIATVRAGNGLTADLHEFLLTDRGTAFVTIYSRARRDLTGIGGLPDAQVTQGIVQEIDVETGRVLFEWRSLDHVEPSEGMRPPPTKPQESYDYFHINSVEELPDGDLLISARATSAIYRVDRETGNVVWRLGGKQNDFDMGPGTTFGLQHDARDLGDGVVQVFDNAHEAKDGERQRASSVKRIALDEQAMTARLVQRFDQPDDMWAESQGNAHPLDGGGVMVGWGSAGAFTRFDADGRVLLDAHLPAEYDSYRAYLERWEGTPVEPPAIDAVRDGDQVTIVASWNGATEIDSWQVLAGPRPDDLEPVGGTTEWAGLETRIVRATEDPFVAVAALDAAGRTLDTSPAVRE